VWFGADKCAVAAEAVKIFLLCKWNPDFCTAESLLHSTNQPILNKVDE
jgi:hypothetical protein